MNIDFKNTEPTVIPNFKGGEKLLSAKMYFDGKNRILHGCLEPGATIGIHKHETNSEIIYILSGKGKTILDDKTEEISEGMVHYCEKGHTHSLINDSNENLIFFAVVPEQ